LRVEIIANKDSFDESKPQSNNEFPVNTKRASTTVLLRNGETVVIGGLSLESSADTENGIPFLADIPGLGYLFKNKGTARKFDETLIFITPNIITAQRQEP
jgi:type IV pilus assembly protein PilQ